MALSRECSLARSPFSRVCGWLVGAGSYRKEERNVLNMHGEEGVGLDWRSKDRLAGKGRGEGTWGERIEAAAASSHGRNRGRRETGGSDPSLPSERILPLMPFKKPFYAPLKTRFLSPDEQRVEQRRRKTLLVARQKLYERAVVSRDKQ